MGNLVWSGLRKESWMFIWTVQNKRNFYHKVLNYVSDASWALILLQLVFTLSRSVYRSIMAICRPLLNISNHQQTFEAIYLANIDNNKWFYGTFNYKHSQQLNQTFYKSWKPFASRWLWICIWHLLYRHLDQTINHRRGGCFKKERFLILILILDCVELPCRHFGKWQNW
jgi:hypothetical protein